MGFFDSFKGGLAAVGETLLSGVQTFAESELGSQFLGGLGQFGLEALERKIGIPSRTAGSPYSTRPYVMIPPSSRLPRPPTEFDDFAVDPRTAYLPGGVLNPVRAGPVRTVRPTAYPSPPPIDASQAYGVSPGTEFVALPAGGPDMPAFPVSRTASFPRSPVGSVINAAFRGGAEQAAFPFAAAGGALLRQLPGVAGGLLAGEALEAISGPGGGTPMFKLTMAGARPQRFRTVHPTTGQDVWFLPAGRPILWSGDFTACKRVKRVARRAARKR